MLPLFEQPDRHGGSVPHSIITCPVPVLAYGWFHDDTTSPILFLDTEHANVLPLSALTSAQLTFDVYSAWTVAVVRPGATWIVLSVCFSRPMTLVTQFVLTLEQHRTIVHAAMTSGRVLLCVEPLVPGPTGLLQAPTIRVPVSNPWARLIPLIAQVPGDGGVVIIDKHKLPSSRRRVPR